MGLGFIIQGLGFRNLLGNDGFRVYNSGFRV